MIIAKVLCGVFSIDLEFTSDCKPGIRRVRRGRNFLYFHPDGRKVSDPAQLARIRSLAIPPAYHGVWICCNAQGHLQATGRDARGRKQYRYHPGWRAQSLSQAATQPHAAWQRRTAKVGELLRLDKAMGHAMRCPR